jgi:DNA-binding transcriptional LysR family regulator
MTLLLVFLGLMRHRRASRVAQELRLTQPAISHALKRLRTLWGDPLFLRRPQGFEPTSVAHALEPRIRAVVEMMAETLATPEPFNPSRSDRVMRLGAYDYELATLLPRLLARMAEGAPAMTVQALPLQPAQALDALADGSIDLALGFFGAVPPGFAADILHDETYRVVARQDHPVWSEFDAVSYAAARHLIVAPRGDVRGIVDQALALQGLARRVAASVPLFFPALASVAGADLVATLPARLAVGFAPAFGLKSAPLPFAVPSFAVMAVRHIRDARSPVHDWVVRAIRAG